MKSTKSTLGVRNKLAKMIYDCQIMEVFSQNEQIEKKELFDMLSKCLQYMDSKLNTNK